MYFLFYAIVALPNTEALLLSLHPDYSRFYYILHPLLHTTFTLNLVNTPRSSRASPTPSHHLPCQAATLQIFGSWTAHTVLLKMFDTNLDIVLVKA